MNPLKHQHPACVACLHLKAHGLWDGFSLAYVELLKTGYDEAAELLMTRQRKIVNRQVRKSGTMYDINKNILGKLMQHHTRAR
jgi:hypothetical protein